MADYQDKFKRILDEKVSDYAARALGPELGEKERTAFIREMRRKVTKLALV